MWRTKQWMAYLINDQSSMESVSNYYIFLDVLKVAEKLRYLSCDTVTYVITDIGLFTTTSFDDKLRPNQPCSKWHSVVQFWRITMNPHTVFDGRGWQQRFSQTNVSLREFIHSAPHSYVYFYKTCFLSKKKKKSGGESIQILYLSKEIPQAKQYIKIPGTCT